MKPDLELAWKGMKNIQYTNVFQVYWNTQNNRALEIVLWIPISLTQKLPFK